MPSSSVQTCRSSTQERRKYELQSAPSSRARCAPPSDVPMIMRASSCASPTAAVHSGLSVRHRNRVARSSASARSSIASAGATPRSSAMSAIERDWSFACSGFGDPVDVDRRSTAAAGRSCPARDRGCSARPRRAARRARRGRAAQRPARRAAAAASGPSSAPRGSGSSSRRSRSGGRTAGRSASSRRARRPRWRGRGTHCDASQVAVGASVLLRPPRPWMTTGSPLTAPSRMR